ncbi:IS3 family transposase [Rhodococcus sp. BP-349]|uniref:IS3 family transposase n=1 Tax=unclassified Rhodococcus (in: high G+C Gram-positive bacteria) TaxID=192944 RepID=UPI001C9B87B7|nr:MULTISPECIES: IS3 family transposase [unclassified Rhodococcus (in: high G+C Gram-positive bacteria)]MBY6540097.1 IS3 family transposase [Rhodococcus sp. BP-363]MBY6543575.1 IS3 family transposase [Rhodococcus sp. BP-369]MBY6562805.1 IS3 family transposase [Rhodococcus sp. BP-370]MBY6577097.1 IS3 family transposase [Rhodococcus sp. BP-364]MBY6586398.1 IS3 family transposase [Rhodococcus sp. BP-358]
MPKAFPEEFRRDVIAVARKGEAPLRQIAKDFGISEGCLHRWLKIADRDDGITSADGSPTSSESVELREARKRIKMLEQEAEVMRRAVGYLSRDVNPKMIYPLVLDLAAEGVPVTVTCRVLGFSTQAFYKWKKAPVTQRDWDDAHLIHAARSIHADDPAFGYRFIADELPDRGITAGENRVARLCSQERIWSVFSKKRGLTRKAGPPVHDDLVDRRFSATAADELWLTDITEHRTDEGKLYLCAIKDVWSNRIVGYSIDSRMKASLAVSALDNAVAQRGPTGTIVHSDRGSQFRSRKFVHALSHNALRGSMGRVGACGDNAAMESFFALLQKNVLDRQRWSTREQLRLAIVTWIERSYHRKRRQRRLGKLTPIEFETINRAAQAA